MFAIVVLSRHLLGCNARCPFISIRQVAADYVGLAGGKAFEKDAKGLSKSQV